MSGLRVTHVGGPTLLIEVGGWRLLTDPTFDPPGRRYRFGWGTSSRKTAGPAVVASEIGRVDAVLLTHDHHADNLDDAGRDFLADVGTVVTTTSGAGRLGRTRTAVTGLAPWSTTTLQAPGLPAIEVTATPCRHGPPLSHPIVGDVVGFGLRLEDRPHGVVWISGDTVVFPGLLEVANRLDVDVAVLHLGGVRFPISGPLRYTMTARGAVRVVEAVQPRVVVPVHFEGWSHFRQGRAGAEREFQRSPAGLAQRVRWLEHGVPTNVDEPIPDSSHRDPAHPATGRS